MKYLILIPLLAVAACNDVKYDGKATLSPSKELEYKTVKIEGREYLATRIHCSDGGGGWALCPKLPALPEQP